MRILFLDDDRNRTGKFISQMGDWPWHTVDFAETAQEAKDLLAKHRYDLASLDHDLGGNVFVPSDAESGYEVTKVIAAASHQPAVIVHSFNPTGAKRMCDKLGAPHIPFGSDMYWETLRRTLA